MSTKNFVPRANNEGGIGTEAKQWGSVWSKNIYVDGTNVKNTLTTLEQNLGTLNTAAATKATTFNSVALMKEAPLEPGMVAMTTGYHNPNDGGAAVYNIRAAVSGETYDNGSTIFLDNGNVAELITDGRVNVKQFGAYGNGTTTDDTAFQNIATYASAKNLIMLVLPATYKVTATITGTFGTFGDVTITGGGTVDIVNLKDVADDAQDSADAAATSESNALSYRNAAQTSAAAAAASASDADTTATALITWLADKETLTAPAVDPTLTISGAAADAEVTGLYAHNLAKDVSPVFGGGYWYVSSGAVTYAASSPRSKGILSVKEGEIYFIETNLYHADNYGVIFGNLTTYISQTETGDGVSAKKHRFVVTVPTGADTMYINNYKEEGFTPKVYKLGAVKESDEIKQSALNWAKFIGAAFVDSSLKPCVYGVYNGNYNENITLATASSWAATYATVESIPYVRVKTTIYGSTYYGLIWTDSDDKIIKKEYLKGSSVAQLIDVYVEVPANASKLYVNGRNYIPFIYVPVNTQFDISKTFAVLTTNCGGFGYGDGTSLTTYQQNWRKMINKSECVVWGVQDWARYFDGEAATIDAQDALVDGIFEGTYPVEKSANDSKRMFYRCSGSFVTITYSTSTYVFFRTIISGVPVYFLNCYFTSGSGNASARYNSASRIITVINTYKLEHCVILGDLNAWTADEYDVWKNNGYICANCGYLGELDTLRDIPADNIICTPNIKILKTEVLDDYSLNTDHKPLLAKLSVMS